MLDSNSLMPHAVCWAAAPHLIWTMVITNLITFLSYLTICILLIVLASRTGLAIARDWIYFVIGFALFILACGSTHLLEVVTTWIPVFWLDAWMNILTAGLSGYVAIMLIVRMPRIVFGINDYARRLASSESTNYEMRENLLAAKKLEEWSRMSASVSHEIRNPLEAIQNLQYLIYSSAQVSPEIAALARSTVEEATRVLTIADSTLSFIRQGRRPEKVDLRAAMDSVRFILNPLIESRQLLFHVEADGNCTVEAFAGEVRQVLLNLVRNACEAVTSPGAKVEVKLTGRSEGVEIVVADQGSGIASDVLDTLFHFGATTKGEAGNGMGLWSVKHIMDRHSGSISVHSIVNQGTRFSLYWPHAFAT